jgi:hypothetical protein
MNHKIGIRVLMTVGALLTGLIGIGHILMPDFGYQNIVSDSMDSSVRDHFYFLGTYAVCLFLLSFSALSLYFSKFANPMATAVVCTIMFFFWGGRAVLEFIYPVSLKIFFLSNPHIVLMPLITFLAFIYFVSTIKSWYLASNT